MVLADTSVWIDHFRQGNARLQVLLEGGEVLVHPFVLGELSCGNFRNRRTALEALARMPAAAKATDKETLEFIEQRSLHGRGIGYIDVHLLASALLSQECLLWTEDKRLRNIAIEMSIDYVTNQL